VVAKGSDCNGLGVSLGGEENVLGSDVIATQFVGYIKITDLYPLER
jgi:hypothetical protein